VPDQKHAWPPATLTIGFEMKLPGRTELQCTPVAHAMYMNSSCETGHAVPMHAPPKLAQAAVHDNVSAARTHSASFSGVGGSVATASVEDVVEVAVEDVAVAVAVAVAVLVVADCPPQDVAVREPPEEQGQKRCCPDIATPEHRAVWPSPRQKHTGSMPPSCKRGPQKKLPGTM